ncbi:MAG: hypothetical protein JO316_19130 [Abitibacteriaceae bacterium]|nr:hypothetical protein [Abditibacteriaceae bacterium]MBV9867471.1 hypothetical protein [Abditibacteriaceae bacterium]
MSPILRTTLLTLTSGILLALCLPPYNVEWVGWFAVAPVLIAAQGRRLFEAMGLGMVASAICGVLHVGWEPKPLLMLAGYVPFLWLSMLVGTITIVGSITRPKLAAKNGLLWVLLLASSGVMAEWLTTLSPLPLYLAVCQFQNLPLIQIAAVTGIWGVSFLVWWVNAVIADAALRRQPFTPIIAATAVGLITVHSYGAFTLTSLRQAHTPSLRVAAIQDREVDATRIELTRQAVRQGAQLVVGSEECLGSSFIPAKDDDSSRKLARSLKAYLVVGYQEEASPKLFNCAALVAPDGKVAGIHRKIHLFSDERQITQPGHDVRAFATSFGKVGMEICYDSCFTDVTRHLAQDGAQIIAMPNYDPPTPHGILHYLHGALQPFRAIENRVPFVRTDSNGLCQIVDVSGHIIGQTPLNASTVLVRDVTLGNGQGTVFTRYGDWFAYLCGLIVVILLRLIKTQRTQSVSDGLPL